MSMVMARVSPQTEEVANVAVSSLGLFLSVIGFPILMSFAAMTGSLLTIVSCSIYGTTLMFLYAASVLLHASLAMNLKYSNAFQVIDHCAIYLLIAGTFTPIGLVTLKADGGLLLFGALWFVAMVGILYKIFVSKRSDVLTTLAYVLMGWSLILVLKPLMSTMPFAGIALIFLGGLLYTFGSLFYIFDHKFTFAHAVWHFFVLGGSLAHFLAIVLYVIPQSPHLVL